MGSLSVAAHRTCQPITQWWRSLILHGRERSSFRKHLSAQDAAAINRRLPHRLPMSRLTNISTSQSPIRLSLASFRSSIKVGCQAPVLVFWELKHSQILSKSLLRSEGSSANAL